jgi:hypothetical protein
VKTDFLHLVSLLYPADKCLWINPLDDPGACHIILN